MRSQVVYANTFDCDAVDLMSHTADALVDSIPLRYPIDCTLRDSIGGRVGRFFLGTDDPGEFDCTMEQATLRSQDGASLHLVDADGQVVEVLLVIGTVQ
jgi:hypothetical protein